RQLAIDEILRPRDDPTGKGWQLDHAYLALPIIHIERNRDYWRRLLAERARAFSEATWFKKWGALLPIGMQAKLLAARLSSPFRYGPHRFYALGSLTRGLPAILALALLTVL